MINFGGLNRIHQIYGFIDLQTKFYHIASFIFFISTVFTGYGQENKKVISKENLLDSISPKAKKPLLLAKVKYTAKDCVRINRKENKIGRATSELQSRQYLVCRLLLEKKK